MNNSNFINLDQLDLTTQSLLRKINEQSNLKVDKNTIISTTSNGSVIASINGIDIYNGETFNGDFYNLKNVPSFIESVNNDSSTNIYVDSLKPYDISNNTEYSLIGVERNNANALKQTYNIAPVSLLKNNIYPVLKIGNKTFSSGYGALQLYKGGSSSNIGYIQIQPGTLETPQLSTVTNVLSLPHESGTIALISDIPSWARSSTKPTYTATEVGALPDTTTIPTKINDLTEYNNFGIGYIDCTNANRYIFVNNVKFGSAGASDYSSYFLFMFIKGTQSSSDSLTIAGTGRFKFYDINNNSQTEYSAETIFLIPTTASLKCGILYIARLNDGNLELSPLTTRSEVNSLIASAIGNINSFEVSVVASLPASDIDTHTIYFVSNSSSGDNIYDEYMYINNNWEKIGSTAVDLSNYLQKTDISDWAKATTKPTYTASEVGAAASNHTHQTIGTYSPTGDGYVNTSINSVIIEASTNGGNTQNEIRLTGTTTTIHNIVTPTADGDAANKKYVDDAIAGVTDTNTTYTLSISENIITLTPSTGTPQTITLPVYNGGVL